MCGMNPFSQGLPSLPPFAKQDISVHLHPVLYDVFFFFPSRIQLELSYHDEQHKYTLLNLI